MSVLPSSVLVTPTPRILQILGQVNFQGWQCVAELIDNSIDAFLRDEDRGIHHGHRSVEVTLPTQSEAASGDGIVLIEDNASGMSLEQIRDACRAGYSGNDPMGKLGLFGMGFNVATVRLGRITELLSHRPGDAAWVGLRIDIDEMQRRGSFEAPVITEPLSETDGQSGTRVRIRRVVRDGPVKSMVTGRGKASLVKRLSRLYHVAMERHAVDIRIGPERLPEWRMCFWDATRSVPTQQWGPVPAQFNVDIPLDSLPYCPNCWEWGDPDQESCLICGGDMIVRQRRISGVLGIQRSFASAWSRTEGDLENYYGIDLVRNGRVIETFDKDLFYWVDPDDPNRRELDYPVDAQYLGGRIIGRLEVDFVPLRSYHKDSFEKTHRAWRDVREALRGESPLRPDVARRHGYDRKDTYLARLFDGYRKTSPAGERYLITAYAPGTKKNRRDPMHRSALLDEWIAGFEAGDPDYQSDAKWWEAVEWAETEDDAWATEQPTVTSPFDTTTEVIVAREQASEAQHSEEALETARDETLTRRVNTEGIVRNGPSELIVNAQRVVRGTLPGGFAVAIDPRGAEIAFTWDPRHPAFRTGQVTSSDTLISELAFQVIYRAQVSQREYPVSYVEREIALRAFPDHVADIDGIADRATDMLVGIRTFLEAELPKGAPLSVRLDEPDEVELERRFASEGIPSAGAHDLLISGEFIRYMPLSFIPKCARLFPSTLMRADGAFSFDYAGYDSEALRTELRESLYSNLLDVAWVVAERGNLGGVLTESARLQLRKGIAALELLELKRI